MMNSEEPVMGQFNCKCGFRSSTAVHAMEHDCPYDKPNSIREEVQSLYAQIKRSTDRLEHLRKECAHELTEEVNYSWRIGNIQRAIVCYHCGELIRYVDKDVDFGTAATVVPVNT